MSLAIQLEFDSIGLNDEELKHYLVKKELQELTKQMGNVRRGIFARHGEIMKLVQQQQIEIEGLRGEIEKLKSNHKD